MPQVKIGGTNITALFPDDMSHADIMAAIYENYPNLDPDYVIKRQEKAIGELKSSLDKAMKAINVTVEPPDLSELASMLQQAMQAQAQIVASAPQPDLEPVVNALLSAKEVTAKVIDRDRNGLIKTVTMSIS